MHDPQRLTAKPNPLRRNTEEIEARLARAEADKWQTLAGLCERVDALDAGLKALTEGDGRCTLADDDTRRTLAFLGERVDALDGEVTGKTRRTLAFLGGRVDALGADVKTRAEGDMHHTLAGLCARVDALDASLASWPAGQASAPDQVRLLTHHPVPACLLASIDTFDACPTHRNTTPL